MAGKTVTEVRLGSPATSGYALRAPAGTAEPDTAVAALDPAYVDQGYVSEDGITLDIDGKQIKIRDWNGDVIAAIEDETSVSLKFTLAQRGEAALKTMYGDANVTAASGAVSKYSYTGEQLPYSQWVFELKDKGGPHRLLLHMAQVTAIGSMEIVKKSVMQQEVTLELFRNTAGVFFTHLLK